MQIYLVNSQSLKYNSRILMKDLSKEDKKSVALIRLEMKKRKKQTNKKTFQDRHRIL